VGQWCDSHNYDGNVQYVFEAGSIGHGQLDQMLGATYYMKTDEGKLRIGGWSFQNKKTIPLQAADVIAYESFKLGENNIAANTGRKVRTSAKALMRAQDLYHCHYWTEKDLRIWIVLLVKEYQKRPEYFEK
jgi:hypothetical protein